jgi:hypothetical protein
VHTLLPDAKIFVVGHSNGGLVAEQWWWNFGRYHPEGVVQVISLDSPLNGIFDAAFCTDLAGSCGPTLGHAYEDLWTKQNTLDPQEVTVDNADKLFTAVGTFGDPLYDVADNGPTTIPTDARIGIVSQLFYTEPSCNSGIHRFDLHTDRCQPAGRYFIDPCSSKDMPLDHDWGPPLIPPGYGAPGSLWMHSVVKNCPGVITKIMSFYPRITPPPAPTGQSASTTPPPPPSTSTPSAPPTGCPGVTYFDARPGDRCSSSGGTLNQGGWTITVGALTPSMADTGRPQLCSQVTAIYRGSEVGLMAGVFWSIETDPPGSPAPTTAGTIGGTMQQTGYIQPGGTAQGTVCFAEVGHPGQVLVVYSAPGGDRALWISNR